MSAITSQSCGAPVRAATQQRGPSSSSGAASRAHAPNLRCLGARGAYGRPLFLTQTAKKATLSRASSRAPLCPKAKTAVPGDHMANAQMGVVPPGAKSLTLETFTLEDGTVMKEVVVAYSTYGTLNAAGDNGVVVGHSLTSNSNVHEWWEVMLGDGPEYTLDTASEFIVCCNYLGSPYGSASPVTEDPVKRAKGGLPGYCPYGGRFPDLTLRDQVRVQKAVLEQLGVTFCKRAIGASMGGMIALEWGATYPEFVGELVIIAACGRHTDWAIGIGEVQRAILKSDLNYRGGFYDKQSKPERGLATARMMAMLSYRAPTSVDEKFGRQTMQKKEGEEIFAVESYLRYQGDKFIGRFDANCYLNLIGCLDTHDVAKGRGEYFQVLAGLSMRTLVVGIDSDMLYPFALQEELGLFMPNATLHKINSPHGHDSFLIEIDSLNETICRFKQGLNPTGEAEAVEALVSATNSAEERERLLKRALTETLQKQKAGEKEVVRLNLRMKELEGDLLSIKQAAQELGEECTICFPDNGVCGNNIESKKELDMRVTRIMRNSQTPWGMTGKVIRDSDAKGDGKVVFGAMDNKSDAGAGWA